MKKFILLLLILAPTSIYTQTHIGNVKVGIFNPSATNGGFIIGYEGGWVVDDIFTAGWSVDWFNKNYIDQNLVAEFNDFYGPNSTLNELRAKTNLHSIPLMATITGSWPIAPKARAFVTGSAGMEVLLVFYRNYENPDNDEFKGTVDFAWRIGTGLSYEVGKRSDVFFELAYHNSAPSWQFNVKDALTGKTKVFERKFDMSGMLMRVGVKFYF